MNKIKLSCLSIELTRRCNLKCSHCFKGESQSIDIPKSYLQKLFGMIEEIYTVHITGGEPSLNLEGMQNLIDSIKNNKIVVHKLNVICNGSTDTTIDFFNMLDELNQMVLQPEDTRITISCDPFHSITGRISLKNLFRGYDVVEKLNENGYSFEVFPYFTCSYPPIVSMGRGEGNSSYANPENPDEYGLLYNRPVNIYGNIIKHISIDANGTIVRDLNISYDVADNGQYQIGHMSEISSASDLLVLAKRWNEKEDVKIRGTLFDIAARLYSPVCTSCPNFYKVYNQRKQLLRQLIDSEEIKHYPAIFQKSNFVKRLKEETENLNIQDTVLLKDAMNCEWWNFTCWKR